MDTLVIIKDPADQSSDDALRRLGFNYTTNHLIQNLKQKRNIKQDGGIEWMMIGGIVVRDVAGRLVSAAAAGAIAGGQAGAPGGPAGAISGAAVGAAAAIVVTAWIVYNNVNAGRAVGGGTTSKLSQENEFLNSLKHRIGECNVQILASLISEMNMRDEVPYGAMSQMSLLKASLYLKLMLEPEIVRLAQKDEDAALNKLIQSTKGRKNKTLHSASARSRSARPRSIATHTARRRN